MTIRHHREQRGVALIVALFALLLLSAIGMGMMFSANMETGVNGNYRDKQTALYAALAGLQEARDRLPNCPTCGCVAGSPNCLTLPAGLPSTSSPNVIYILNPSSGDTVHPWSSSSSNYMDTDLCHAGVLGLSGSASSACTSVPSGSSWYTTYDDSSSSYTGAYKRATPLPYKWTRVMAKADNMTPVATQSPTTGTLVCWDGNHQIPLPTGYGTQCIPIGALASITLTSSGTGYSSPPTVTIGAPPSGGTQATATATITPTSNGQVSSIGVTAGGSGYTSAPTVTLSGGGGSGATATATIVPPGAPVQSVSLASTGSPPGCYGTVPAVSFSGGGGNGATATAALTGQTCIYAWTVSGSCTNEKGATINVGANGGGGSGFSGTITFKANGSVSSYSIDNPGSGYTSSPTGVTGVSGCTPTITWALGYQVSSVTLTAGGAGYSSAPTVNIAPPNDGGTPTATATLGSQPANAGQVTAVTVTSGGSGYTSPPAVSFSGGSGTGATAIASIGTTYQVTAVTLTNAGSGYITQPAVTFSGGGGSGAAGFANLANGPYYGQVLLLTTLARTPWGSRAMAQMEVATPYRGGLSLPGALTFDGPSAVFNAPSSHPFYVNGNDANTCGQSTYPAKPAVGVYDDPNNPTSPTSQSEVTAGLPQPSNYTGAQPAPDVENVFNQLGSLATPSGVQSLATAVASVATNTYSSNPSPGSLNLGTASNPTIDVVNGDLNISGNPTGYGILLVTGTLTLSGNFTWKGIVLVIGQGSTVENGGGSANIDGTFFVAKSLDSNGNLLSTLGTPDVNWNGGGSNSISYDHCYDDNLLSRIPFVPTPPSKPLTVLSVRTITY